MQEMAQTRSNRKAAAAAALGGSAGIIMADTANNARTEGAPQQTVVNGWTAKDLLTVIAREGARPSDERPAALLVLVVIGIAGMMVSIAACGGDKGSADDSGSPERMSLLFHWNLRTFRNL